MKFCALLCESIVCFCPFILYTFHGDFTHQLCLQDRTVSPSPQRASGPTRDPDQRIVDTHRTQLKIEKFRNSEITRISGSLPHTNL